MIRRPLPGARFNVDPGIYAATGQRFGSPDVVDAQTHVAAKGARSIIPPGKLSALFVMQPEGVGKTPALNLVERGPFSLAAHDPLLPKLWIVDITILGRHVEIATQNHWRTRLVVEIKKTTQTLHPIELKHKLL